MTEERPDGWGSVPHTDDVRGTPFDAATTSSAHAPGTEHVPGTAHAPGAEQSPTGPAAPIPGPYAQYHPTPRARRRPGRRAVVGIVAGGAALLLLVVAGVVGWSVGSAAHAPTHQVEAFLDDLESGHAQRALADAGVDVGKDDVLLTDAAYRKATGRVSGHRILGVDTNGGGATVRVLLRQGGVSVPATFQLTQHGTDFGVFPKWRLDPVSLGAVDVTVDGPANTPLTIGGTTAATNRQGTVTLKALPGTYAIAVDGGGWYSSKTATARVSGFGGTASSPVVVQTSLTDKGRQASESAVNAWVDHCIASTSIEPAGCSFYAYGEDPSNTYSNERWTLDSRPGFGLSDWASKGWVVRTTTPGSATFSADFTGPSGTGVGEAGPIDVYADGYISGFTSAGATFVAAVADDGSGQSGS